MIRDINDNVSVISQNSSDILEYLKRIEKVLQDVLTDYNVKRCVLER